MRAPRVQRKSNYTTFERLGHGLATFSDQCSLNLRPIGEPARVGELARLKAQATFSFSLDGEHDAHSNRRPDSVGISQMAITSRDYNMKQKQSSAALRDQGAEMRN